MPTLPARPFQWRHFQFFNRDEVEEPPACFQGDEGGRLTHLKSLDAQGKLVTLGEDANANGTPTARIWSLRKTTPDGHPMLLKAVSVQQSSSNSSKTPYPVTAFDVLDNLTQMAIGFADGRVVVVRGQLIKDRSSKQRTVWSGEEAVTGLALCERNNMVHLYVTTLSKTVVCNTTTNKEHQLVIDEHGCAVGCVALNAGTGDLVLGREEAIFSYTPDGRGPCYAFE
ncbi:hypothetical protein THASP1DRAFT_33565, partial [Thamnocephalis sphaerospora]